MVETKSKVWQFCIFITITVQLIYLKIKLSGNTELGANTLIMSLFLITAPEAGEGETAVWGETVFDRTSPNVLRHLCEDLLLCLKIEYKLLHSVTVVQNLTFLFSPSSFNNENEMLHLKIALSLTVGSSSKNTTVLKCRFSW